VELYVLVLPLKTGNILYSEVGIGGASLAITIPVEIVRKLGLEWRDRVYWTIEPEGVRLKIVKRAAVLGPGVHREAEAPAVA
jgi:hypothetical protein